MNNNIKQNYLLHINKILDKVDKDKTSDHFRAVVLMGDTNKEDAYCWVHASLDDVASLLLEAMRKSKEFAYCTAMAIETYYNELQNKESNEKDSVQED